MQTYIDKVVDKVKNDCGIKNNYLARYYALLVLVKGTDITLQDVHDAWAMSMNFSPQTDYCYGHEHKSIVPFEDLDSEVQNKDARFVERLKKVAKEL